MTVGEAGFDSYRQNRAMKRAVERELEIISEATRRITLELKDMEPDIPWREIAGIGNVLQHGYQIVSDTIIWNVVELYLPMLEIAVIRMIDRLNKT